MTIQFRVNSTIEQEYDKRARLMIRGIKEKKLGLINNIADLFDLDVELAKEGEP